MKQYIFNTFTLFSFFKTDFSFAFQSSFDHFFLIVSTIIFSLLFFILFIYLKTCVYGFTLIVTDVEIYLYDAECRLTFVASGYEEYPKDKCVRLTGAISSKDLPNTNIGHVTLMCHFKFMPKFVFCCIFSLMLFKFMLCVMWNKRFDIKQFNL